MKEKIEIRWQSTRSPNFEQAHGIDFENENTIWCGITWKKYLVFLAEQCTACLRVWLNSVIVWDYINGWYPKDLPNVLEFINVDIKRCNKNYNYR